ncbi:MAG: hypothetical protein P8L85_00700 [Rubripirellula sp.]|nr:hypothetical protein [Rubripirellula sp.]
MKLSWIIFALLLLMCGSLGSLLLTPEPTVVIIEGEAPVAAGHGMPHPQIGTMLVGGDSEQRYAPIRPATWIFAVCMICFFTALLALGSLKAGRFSKLNWFLLVGLCVQLFAMVGMLLSYESFIGDAAPRLYAGFPAPTAWMLYALWPAPLLFVVFYVVAFDRWTFRPEDESAFKEILQRRARTLATPEERI